MEKSITLKSTVPLVGIWRFDIIIANKAGTINFPYGKNYVVEFTDDNKYEIRREESNDIIRSGVYASIRNNVYIADSTESLINKYEWLLIEEYCQSYLSVTHSAQFGRRSVGFSYITFSRRE